jgi:hypothetical protein
LFENANYENNLLEKQLALLTAWWSLGLFGNLDIANTGDSSLT